MSLKTPQKWVRMKDNLKLKKKIRIKYNLFKKLMNMIY